MPVRARFRPHPRGFGFLNAVAPDGITPATFSAEDPSGAAREFDSLFVPPPLAGLMVADDLVDAEVEVDQKGASATEVTLVDRPRRMLVGTVQRGPGRLVLEPDHGIGTGWIDLAETVTARVGQAVGRQIVVLCGDAEDGAPIGRALVAGPHVVGSPAAIRASAAVVTLGRAAPSLVPGGAAGAGLDPAAATTTHTRVVGQVAGGGRGAAAGLSFDGPIPGGDLEPVDRRDEPCVTIDDAATRDLDDAVHAAWDGGSEGPVDIVVHIADAAAAVGLGSEADRYARTVATTAYLRVGGNAPMLDPLWSEDALSLLPEEDRWALSVRFRVTPDGAITDVGVEHSLIRSVARLTYAALDDWLGGDRSAVTMQSGGAPVVPDLVDAAVEAARRLGVERDARTTFEALFASAEVDPDVVEGKLSVVPAEPHADAYRLVERLMVAANETVASWLVGRGVPALYRAHTGLDPERADRLRAAVALAGASVPSLEAAAGPEGTSAEDDTVAAELLAEIDRLGAEGRDADRDLLVAVATGSTARASYDPDPAHHRGLAAEAYCHFTSPIRRYADLVIHRQVRATLAGEPPPHDVAELAGLAPWLDARAGAVNHLAARERGDLWARLLDRGYLDGPEEAVVTGLTQNGLRIRLPRLGLGGFVTAEKALGLPRGERGSLEVDEHGLTTTSGPWRVGSTVKVRFVRLDDTNRPVFLLGDGPG